MASRHSLARRLPLVALLALFAGCGGGGPNVPMANVSGTVTVKGAPLTADGYGVNFLPEEGVGGTLLRIDENGKYEGEAPVGNNKVAVVAMGTTDGGHAATADAGILDKYTTDSTSGLSTTIEAGKENTFDCEVGQ